MRKIGFSNEKYIELQSKHIKERIKQFDNKLYLEFGGKLFDDHHASRVLPGFEPDSKLKMLLELKQDAEIIIVINANDIENNKMRGDLGITYDLEVLRLIDAFQNIGLYVGSVTITRFENQVHAIAFQKKLENLGIKVFRHYPIAGYPNDIEKYCMYKSQIIEKIYKEIGLKWKKAIRGTLFGWFYFVLALNSWWF